MRRRTTALLMCAALLAPACTGGDDDSAIDDQESDDATDSSDGDPASGGADESAVMPVCAAVTYLVACVEQAARASVPLPGLLVDLAYTSERQRIGSGAAANFLEQVGMGGWTLSGHHFYDVENEVAYFGNGDHRSTPALEIQSGEESGNLAVVDDDLGEVYVFDGDGRHLRTRHADLGMVIASFEYEDRLLSAVDVPTAGRMGIVRNGSAVVELVGARYTATLSIDSSGGLARVTDPGGVVTELDTDADDRIVGYQYGDLGTFEFEYDANGFLAMSSAPDGSSTTFARKADQDGGFTVAIEESSGDGGTYTEELVGGDRLLRYKPASGGEITELIEADRHELGDLDGTVTELVLSSHPLWGPAMMVPAEIDVTLLSGESSSIATDVESTGELSDGPFVGQVVTTRTSLNDAAPAVTVWDQAARTLGVTSPEGRASTVRFDELGRSIEADDRGVASTVSYDGSGVPEAVTWADGAGSLDFGYDADGTISVSSDGFERWTRLDRVSRSVTTSAPGGDDEVGISLTDAGSMAEVALPGGATRQVTYDDQERPTSLAFGPEDPTISWTYDDQGISTMTDGETSLTIGRDPLARPVSISSGDVDLREFGYDDEGWLSSSSSSDLTVRYPEPWNSTGPIELSGAVDTTIEYSLDEDLAVSSVMVGGAAPTEIDYDADGLPVRIGAAEIDRDSATGLVTEIRLDDVAEVREYDAQGALSSRTVTFGGEVVIDLTIERDALGRVISVVEMVEGESRTTEYSYDVSGQLAAETTDGATTTYRYDDRGNLTEIVRDSASRAIEYDDADRIVSVDASPIASDASGRPTRLPSTEALSYDEFGNLSSTGADTRQRLYDPFGRLVGVEGQSRDVLVYGGGYQALARVIDGDVTQRFAYVDGELAPNYVEEADRRMLVVRDHGHTPQWVVDAATGEIISSATYSAFGAVNSRTGDENVLPFGFHGGTTFGDDDVIRFGARDYISAVGRFLQLDPIYYGSEEMNLYRFAANDPVNLWDPTGLNPTLRALVLCLTAVACDAWAAKTVEQTDLFPDQATPTMTYGKRRRTGEVRLDPLGRPIQPTPPRPPSGLIPGAGPDPMKGGRRPHFPRGVFPGDDLIPRQPTRYHGRTPRALPQIPGGVMPPSRSSLLALAAPGGGAAWYQELQEWAASIADVISDLLDGLAPGTDDGDDQQDESSASKSRLECLEDPGCDLDAHRTTTYGHPNIRTWDRVTYSFHGAGDYLLASDREGWDVHVRFSRIANMRRVSFVRAVAVRVGEQTISVGDAPDLTAWDPAELQVDGEVVDLNAGEVYALDAGEILFTGNSWVIVDDRERALIVGDQIGDAYTLRLPTWELWDQVVGLSGTPDGDPANDIRAADGRPIDPALFDELYNVFGASWLVAPEESLFETPLDPVDEDPIFPEANLLLSDFDEEIRRQAEATCREAGNEPGSGLNECMFDLVLTGDARWAEAMGPIAQLTRSGVHWRLIDPRIDDDQEIELGQVVDDELETTGAHRYRFTAEAGDRVVLRLTDPCGDATPTTLVAGFVGPDGLVTESISLTDCGDSKPLLVEDAGEFALLVTDEQGLSTSFAFQLVAATDQDKGEIEIGEMISDEFAARSDVHAWIVDAGDADAVSVNALDVPCDATWLLERDGEPVWSDDGCVTSPPLPTGGEMRLLLIADFGGPYEFELFAVPPPVEADLPDDGAVTGEIAEPGGSAVYFVEIDDGRLIQIFSDTDDCDLGRVFLDAPSGDVFQGRDLCRDSGPYGLPETGRWGVRVDPPGDVTGDYAFRVAVIDDTRSGGEAAIGERVEGTIASPGESVSFELDAAPGDQFQVVAGNTECGLSDLILEGTDGSFYYFDDLCEDHVIRVNDSGVVRLVVDPDSDQTGPFSFQLVPVVTMRSDFSFGEVLQGSIDTVGGRYVFPITVPDGGITMQIVETGTECGFSQLYWAPPGATRFQYQAELCEDHVISIDDAGEYELIVDPSGLQTGRFSFRAFEIVEPTPVPVQLGSQVRGSLDTPGEYAVYTFTTTVDDAEFEFVSGTDDCDFSQAFYRPAEGGGLRYWGNLCEDHVIRVDEAGEWAIVIDPGDARTGDFAFTLRPA